MAKWDKCGKAFTALVKAGATQPELYTKALAACEVPSDDWAGFARRWAKHKETKAAGLALPAEVAESLGTNKPKEEADVLKELGIELPKAA